MRKAGKMNRKHFKTDSKTSILTLFNKFLVGFKNFKKYYKANIQ